MEKDLGAFTLDEMCIYKPQLTNKPDDFTDFWNNEKFNLKSIDSKVKLIWRQYPVSSVEVADITFESWDNTPLSGILLKPKSASAFPLIFNFHGYTGSRGLPADYLKWITLGVGVVSFDIRGQGDSPDCAKYKTGSRVPGWMLHGIEEKSNYYYTNVYRDIIMQMNWVRSTDFPYSVTKLGVMGGSQGGGLAIIAAGLESSIEFLIADWPFISHIEIALEIATSGPYMEIADYFKWNDPQYKKYDEVLKTLGYIDSVHFCQYINCSTLMAVGLKDIVTPPLTVFAAFNHIQSAEKQIEVYPQFGHELNPFHEEKKLAFVAKILGEHRYD